ncbi:helix-turn-helix domain-containing protein [Nocardia uniformis]|uniref:Helix-turn-helix domain-containing protein n=1 Tax=Nocardia uniformis TaxID=53432 RepID=A0A849CL37_9NOCA|nr:helix-turn-helix transcriptional regulator [Nocardia uniformis]NNH76051.1 helix-turn-helix domain-containing protein [Nocardia uniformis]
MAPKSPAVARWELSYRLRRRREVLGITGPQLAKDLGFSRTYWPKVERDQRILTEGKLTDLLALLDFPEDERVELLDLRNLARQRAWWNTYEGLFNEEQLRLWGLEAGAQEISTTESLLIPGLLQTEDYARALITADTAFIRQIEVDQRIEARMHRQERLTDADPLRLNVVVSEAVVRQLTGGVDVLRGQLQHLITMINKHPDTLDFRVLPFSSTTGAIFGCSTFHILDFARPHQPTLGWSEALDWGELIEDENRIRILTVGFGHLQNCALNPEESLALIEQLADRIEASVE